MLDEAKVLNDSGLSDKNVRTACASAEGVMQGRATVGLLVLVAILGLTIFSMWMLHDPYRHPPKSKSANASPAPASLPLQRGPFPGTYKGSWSKRDMFRHLTLHAITVLSPVQADNMAGFLDVEVHGSASASCYEVAYTLSPEGRMVLQDCCLPDDRNLEQISFRSLTDRGLRLEGYLNAGIGTPSYRVEIDLMLQ